MNEVTGKRYGDDPNIVAIEPFNEPKRDSAGQQATDYINCLARPARALGYRGPICYNISEQGNRPPSRLRLRRRYPRGLRWDRMAARNARQPKESGSSPDSIEATTNPAAKPRCGPPGAAALRPRDGACGLLLLSP